MPFETGKLTLFENLMNRYVILALPKVCPVFKRSYRTINYDHMKTLVANISLDYTNPVNPDIMLTKWHNSMLAILDQVAPCT